MGEFNVNKTDGSLEQTSGTISGTYNAQGCHLADN